MRPVSSRRPDDGAAALEFGLVAPIILLMIFAIIQYGYVYWSLQTASATAREAARRLVVGTDWACTAAEAAGQAARPSVGGAAPTVTRAYRREDGTALPGPEIGQLVTVTVSFQTLDLGLPFLPVPGHGLVSQDATARVENIPTVPLTC